MKTIRSIFLLFLLLTVGVAAQAQVPELVRNASFRADAQAAVDSLYNFNAAGAEEQLAEWQQQYPDHPLWKLFDGMTLWWQVLSDLENHAYDEEFFRLMKEADYAASKVLHEQPGHADALIIKAVANGYIGRHHANRNEWITSLRYARTAYKAYQYLQNQMPDLADLKLAEGLKLYYAEYLPEAYPVVNAVSWFLPDGNKQKGLKLLEEASKTAIFARAEATYFLGNINLNYEHNYNKAAGYFKGLYEAYPNNNYYARLLVKNYFTIEQYDKALQTINQTLNRWNEHDLPFAKVLKSEMFYWKGRILLRRGQNNKAADLLIQSFEWSKQLPRNEHRSFYAGAAYFAGDALLFAGRPAEAEAYFKIVIDSQAGEGYEDSARNKLKQIRSAR